MSATQPNRVFWRSFQIFEDFGNEAVAALAEAAMLRSWPAGTMLFQRGDAGDHMIALSEGRVKLSLITLGGKELALRHVEAGAILGEMALLDGQPRSADAVTVVPSHGHVIMRGDFDRLLEKHPSCARSTIHYLCRRLRETTEQMESIALYELDARLARFFLATLRQIHGEELPDEARLSVPLSQGELAGVLGASRPKVNRAFASLEEAGAIRREGTAIGCDIALLMDLAEPLEG
ncbi:MAG: Crp/Fnr family transcriptional regulator [Devosia sp.]